VSNNFQQGKEEFVGNEKYNSRFIVACFRYQIWMSKASQQNPD
jgi:hypothetical protein